MNQQVFLLVLCLLLSFAMASESCKGICKLFKKEIDRQYCLKKCRKMPMEPLPLSESESFVAQNLITTTAVNMRNGPCTDRGIIKLLGEGTRLTFTGQVQNGCGYTWYSVSDGTNGWVASLYVKEVAAPATDLWATDAVNVRNGPCTNAGVITTLQTGAQVQWRGESRDGCGYNWKKIFGGFGEGWAASNYLSSNRPQPTGGVCRSFTLFKQCDGRWGGNTLGSGCTICGVGCLMTSVSMAMNSVGKTIDGQAVTPAVLNNFLRWNGGYSGCNYMWGTIGRFGFSYQGQFTNKAALKPDVCNPRKIVILAVNNYGHWVLAKGHDNGGFFVNDPGYNKEYYHDWEVAAGAVYNI